MAARRIRCRFAHLPVAPTAEEALVVAILNDCKLVKSHGWMNTVPGASLETLWRPRHNLDPTT